MELALSEDQDMAIRNDDWKRITDEIGDQIQKHLNPHGWRRAFHILREWAPLGGIFAVVLGLIAIVVTLIVAVSNRREVDGKFQGTTETRLTSIEGTLKSLSASVDAIRLQKISDNVTDPQTVHEADEILTSGTWPSNS